MNGEFEGRTGPRWAELRRRDPVWADQILADADALAPHDRSLRGELLRRQAASIRSEAAAEFNVGDVVRNRRTGATLTVTEPVSDWSAQYYEPVVPEAPPSSVGQTETIDRQGPDPWRPVAAEPADATSRTMPSPDADSDTVVDPFGSQDSAFWREWREQQSARLEAMRPEFEAELDAVIEAEADVIWPHQLESGDGHRVRAASHIDDEAVSVEGPDPWRPPHAVPATRSTADADADATVAICARVEQLPEGMITDADLARVGVTPEQFSRLADASAELQAEQWRAEYAAEQAWEARWRARCAVERAGEAVRELHELADAQVEADVAEEASTEQLARWQAEDLAAEESLREADRVLAGEVLGDA